MSARIPPTTTRGDDPNVPPRKRMMISVSIFWASAQPTCVRVYNARVIMKTGRRPKRSENYDQQLSKKAIQERRLWDQRYIRPDRQRQQEWKLLGLNREKVECFLMHLMVPTRKRSNLRLRSARKLEKPASHSCCNRDKPSFLLAPRFRIQRVIKI